MRPIYYLIILATLLLMTACGGGSEATTADGSEARPTKTIRLLTWRYLPQDREWVRKFEKRYNVGVAVTVKPVGEIIRAAQANQTTGSDLILPPQHRGCRTPAGIQSPATFLRQCLHQR